MESGCTGLLNALPNENHESVTMVMPGPDALPTFMDLVVAFDFRCWTLIPQFGLFDCCDIGLMAHKNISELQDL